MFVRYSEVELLAELQRMLIWGGRDSGRNSIPVSFSNFKSILYNTDNLRRQEVTYGIGRPRALEFEFPLFSHHLRLS